jgi:hypothetical protein
LENKSRDILLYGRIVDLHRRKTEAVLLGCGTNAYRALIEVYEMQLAEVLAARSKQSGDPNPEAA